MSAAETRTSSTFLAISLLGEALLESAREKAWTTMLKLQALLNKLT